MIKKYFKKIKKIKTYLILTKRIGNKILNSAIFGENIPEDLVKFKKEFLLKIKHKNIKLNKILTLIKKDNNILKTEKEILEREIFIKIKKLDFLEKVYDTEANKLDKRFKIKKEIKNYDYYNKIFYGVSKKDLNKNVKIHKNKPYNIFISKKELIKLLKLSKKIIPDLKWRFGNFINLSHNSGLINIPDNKEYNIKRIIVIFFHEMTHFFRHINGKNNIKYNYIFEDYISLEEGITSYNEYKYGNKIMDYGMYNPYYDKCYKILLKNINEKEKKEKLYKILKNKGFTRDKIDNYYIRFYIYAKIGGKDLFLKELIYTKAYKNILKLLKQDKNNYEKIMAGKIGINEVKNNYIKKYNNFDSKAYFKIMVKEIKKII